MVTRDSKYDISIVKIINYIFLFLIPLVLLYILSSYFSILISPILEVSPNVATQILMFILSFITFFIMIPFLRVRESIKAVRFSLFSFVIVGFIITIPSLLKGNFQILMSATLYLGNFIFATFINCPDVIGVGGDYEDWFEHQVQIIILVIYIMITLLYITGFAWIHYEMSLDTKYPNSYSYMYQEKGTYMTFFYFSFVTTAMVNMGEIMPLGTGPRIVFCLQTLLAMVVNVIFIATLLMYVGFSQSLIDKKQEKEIMEEERMIAREHEMIKKEEKRIEELEKRAHFYNERNQAQYPNYLDGKNNFR